MIILKNILTIFLNFSFLNVILSKEIGNKPKCCIGSENFGIGLYSSGESCIDMINCCPSGAICSSGRCIFKNNKKRRRKISKNYRTKEKKEINLEDNNDKGPIIKNGEEIIKPKKIERKPTFNGPVKINWKTFTECLKDRGPEDQIAKEIINDYNKKQESSAMKKVFAELKKNTPLIIECLNQQEHLKK